MSEDLGGGFGGGEDHGAPRRAPPPPAPRPIPNEARRDEGWGHSPAAAPASPDAQARVAGFVRAADEQQHRVEQLRWEVAEMERQAARAELARAEEAELLARKSEVEQRFKQLQGAPASAEETPSADAQAAPAAKTKAKRPPRG